MIFLIPTIFFIIFLFVTSIIVAIYFSPNTQIKLEDKPKKSTVVSMCLITLILGTWLGLFASSKIEEKEIIIESVQYIDKEKYKIAVINYFKNNKMIFVNLNAKLGIQIPEGSKIKITQYKEGNYYGLSYEALEDKLEIL